MAFWRGRRRPSPLSISGLVTDGTNPVAEVEVCASKVSGEEEFGCAETDSLGEYTIGGLASGSYKVEFWTPPSLNLVPQYFNGKSTWATADLVTVTSGNDTPDIDAVLEEGGWIEGRAVDAVSGLGIEELVVCAFPIDETGFGRCAYTDANGDYELPGLATDSYEVFFFSEEGSPYLPQFYNGKESFREATPVSVTVGMGTGNINAHMKKGGVITGTVTDAASGAGVRSSIVCLLPASEAEIIGCGFTNGSGGYSIFGLRPGAYKILFSPDIPELEEDDYVQQYYNDKPTFAQADPISVSAGSTASGIDARLVSRKAAPAQTLLPAPIIVAPRAPAHKKPLRCPKGKHKIKKKGKFHCVKTHHRHKRHRAHHRGRLYRPAAHRSIVP